MANEDIVLNKIKSKLKKTPHCIGLRITNTTGVPDLIACVNGHFLGIEIKDDKEGAYGLTKAQKMRLRHIMDAGGVACVVDKNNADAFGTFLESVSAGKYTVGKPYTWGIGFDELKAVSE